MTATVYREGCGTRLALRLHQVNGEPPCSECLRAEYIRRLELELIPQRPPQPFQPVTAAEAEQNRAVLEAAIRPGRRTS